MPKHTQLFVFNEIFIIYGYYFFFKPILDLTPKDPISVLLDIDNVNGKNDNYVFNYNNDALPNHTKNHHSINQFDFENYNHNHSDPTIDSKPVFILYNFSF